MKAAGLIIGMFFGLALLVQAASASASSPITYRYKHHLITIGTSSMADWERPKEQWFFYGKPIVPPKELLTTSGSISLPEGFTMNDVSGWNKDAIAQTIQEQIASVLNRDAGSVTIKKNASGAIVFDGVGFPGRAVDIAATVALTINALENGVTDIMLPILESQPSITVLDPELRQKGIAEFVTMGESDFHGSTNSRIHNVTVGLNKFNAHLIEKDEIFSFVEILGPVDGSTGYVKELVIKGDKTVPDFGGGLCQVSSTAYRGIWEYGFPVTQRKNHSYAVHYYSPQGTDATVYPPDVDIKFKNDSPGALLMQTVIDVPNTKAYFIYYGTKDERKSEVIGPFTWARTAPPPPRTEYTTTLAPGAQRKLGEAVYGMRTAWFRMTKKDGEEKTDGTYSIYQARPYYVQIGVDALPAGGVDTGGVEAAIAD